MEAKDEKSRRWSRESSPKGVAQTELERQALELRMAGARYLDIAKALKLGAKPNKGTAYRVVMRALAKTKEERDGLAAETRDLELERLDRLTRAIFATATQGNLQAVDRVLKIMERRARLLGLDAPAQTQVSGPDGGPIEVSDARAKLLARLTALNPAGQADGGGGDPQ